MIKTPFDRNKEEVQDYEGINQEVKVLPLTYTKIVWETCREFDILFPTPNSNGKQIRFHFKGKRL